MACTHFFEGTIKVGSHYFADQFLKNGWNVTYFSAPVTPLHLVRLRDKEVRNRMKAIFRGGPQPVNELVTHVPFSLIAPDGRPPLNSRLVTDNWHRTLIPHPARIAERLGVEDVDLLYVDNIFQSFWFDVISCKKSIFRVMDRHGSFPGWRNRAEEIAKSIAERADLTIYSARHLQPYVLSLSPKKSAFIPNGVDFEFFQKQGINLNKKTADTMSRTKPPRALYVGAIDHRLDLDLLRAAAMKLPHVTFVLAGPVHPPVDTNNLPDNILIVGPVPHHELSALMRRVSLGIIPFDTQRKYQRIEGIRPLKLFEYLAAGLPVVCARWPEVESIGSPAYLYSTLEEFIEHVQGALESPPPAEAAQVFAENHDWSRSFAKLMDVLDRTTSPLGEESHA